MPIVETYSPDPLLAASLARDAGQGQFRMAQDDRLRSLDQFLAGLGEDARQFDARLAYGSQQDAAQRGQQDAALFQQAQQHAQDWQGRFALEAMNQQGQQNYLAAQQGFIGQQSAAGMARDLYQTQLRAGLSEAEAIQKALLDGDFFTSDAQVKAAWDAYEQRWAPYGLHRGSLQEMAQQNADAEMQQQMADMTSAFLNPMDSSPVFSPDQWSAMRSAGMEDKDIVAAALKQQSELRQQMSAEAKQAEAAQNLDFRETEAAIDNKAALEQNEIKNQQAIQGLQFRQFEAAVDNVNALRMSVATMEAKYAEAMAQWHANKEKARSSSTPDNPVTFEAPQPSRANYVSSSLLQAVTEAEQRVTSLQGQLGQQYSGGASDLLDRGNSGATATPIGTQPSAGAEVLINTGADYEALPDGKVFTWNGRRFKKTPAGAVEL